MTRERGTHKREFLDECMHSIEPLLRIIDEYKSFKALQFNDSILIGYTTFLIVYILN